MQSVVLSAWHHRLAAVTDTAVTGAVTDTVAGAVSGVRVRMVWATAG